MRAAPRVSATAATISATERAPGSIWPIERSPRNEARPRSAFIGTVAPRPRRRRPRLPPRSCPPRSASCTGSSTSSIVFWPTCDLPRALTASIAAEGVRQSSARSGSAGRLLAERHEQRAVERAGCAADLHHQLRADRLQRLGQRLCGKCRRGRRARASKPRFMLSPWSPSPIAWSSAVNSSAWPRSYRRRLRSASVRSSLVHAPRASIIRAIRLPAASK